MLHLLYIILFAMTATPTITLKKNTWTKLQETHFKNATDGKETKQITDVKLKADEDYLSIEFSCLQNPFVGENTYTKHNSEMYNQEVFEIFIAEGTEIPTRYLELEINPNNALFAGWIENPSKEAPQSCQFVSHEEAKIIHSVSKTSDSWSGKMQIPWALLGGKKDNFRINFYRIISLKSHGNADWKGTPATCAYLCWNSTMSGSVPRFHRPDAFGILKIEK
ncbi:hypothetical protein Emtol_1141 [Emticicia oligotrophica DSM 17448]|uniref:Carbohydrate-binding domain-containing protein n=1 Tax=Emticicia oligotrophica (strain DSM 17448 / CIP 109782 / MTCC 6937 / GPTSA100-15) TaxID=929562 RepID=A0ABM5MYW0_EMTOG|nr:carbohydrate-binding family 9-like protein [Emticicia oligotrophica]AFK02290.1 hypothetical protein Emtol_1141 [Emticicia oligotrophica DSM 17448]